MGYDEQLLIDFPVNGEHGDARVTITELDDGENGYRLAWDDGVVNAWDEWYASLPDAIARSAVLAKCVLDTNDRTVYAFRTTASAFSGLAEDFFDDALDRVVL
jgi:hypothetical protein